MPKTRHTISDNQITLPSSTISVLGYAEFEKGYKIGVGRGSTNGKELCFLVYDAQGVFQDRIHPPETLDKRALEKVAKENSELVKLLQNQELRLYLEKRIVFQ